MLGVYKGLALNFMRPRFIRKLREPAPLFLVLQELILCFSTGEFKPDVIQFVDPIWLCAQAIPLVQYYFPDVPLVASYHTNLASYSTLFGFSWLTPTMWNLMVSPKCTELVKEGEADDLSATTRSPKSKRRLRFFSSRSATSTDDASSPSALHQVPPGCSNRKDSRTFGSGLE